MYYNCCYCCCGDGGRGARYRETRCDSYRKRCGGEAVSCGVTAMASEGTLLLVLRLVDPLVLFSRRVRLLIVDRGHDQFYVNQADESRSRGSMRKRVVKKDGIFFFFFMKRMTDGRDDVNFIFEISLLSVDSWWSIVDTEVHDNEQRPWRKKKDVTMLIMEIYARL